MRLKLASLLCLLCLLVACKEKETHSVDLQSTETYSLDLTTLKPTILKQDGNEIHLYWELDNRIELWVTGIPIGKALQAYRDSIEQALGPETFTSFSARERHIGQRDESQPKDSLDNWDIVHQGLAGRIRDINLLESELLNYQASRYPLFSHPTEFHGFILRNNQTQKIRAYFSASDTEFPPKPRPVETAVDSLHAQGWKLMYHLHNHFRKPHENYIGAMGPSMPDAQFLKYKREDYGLQTALITNGFTTCVIPAKELDIFNSH